MKRKIPSTSAVGGSEFRRSKRIRKMAKTGQQTQNQSTIQKIQNPSNDANEVPSLTTITDVNDDCLEKIFEHLDIQSLFNVAASNKWLVPAARSVYRRKFGTVLHNIRSDCTWGYIQYIVFPSVPLFTEVTVFGLKSCLQMLRLFGPSITKLSYDLNLKASKYIEQYIEKYCTDSLVELSIHDGEMPHYQKPFDKVERVSLSSVKLGKHLQYFNQWFPNLRFLEMSDCESSRTFEIPSFEHFETLEIYSPTIPNKRIAHLLQSNPEVKNLTIVSRKIKFSLLFDILSANRSISKLKIVPYGEVSVSDVTEAELDRFAEAHPLVANLDIREYKITAVGIMHLIRQINTLNRIQCAMDRSEYDNLMTMLDDKWQTQYLHWVFGHCILSQRDTT